MRRPSFSLAGRTPSSGTLPAAAVPAEKEALVRPRRRPTAGRGLLAAVAAGQFQRGPNFRGVVDNDTAPPTLLECQN